MNYLDTKNPSTNYNYFYFKNIKNSYIKMSEYEIHFKKNMTN